MGGTMNRVFFGSLILAMAVRLSLAGVVSWGDAYIWELGEMRTVIGSKTVSPSFGVIYENIDTHTSPTFYVSAEIGVETVGGKINLKAIDDHVLNWGTTLALMDIGDVVDYNSTVGADEVFYSFYCKDGGKSEETLSDYDVTLLKRAEQLVYFGFATNITPNDEPSFLYGWISLKVSPGSISVDSAVIDLRGGPMTVGVIPEPSSALLLLFGIAPLALRRRHGL